MPIEPVDNPPQPPHPGAPDPWALVAALDAAAETIRAQAAAIGLSAPAAPNTFAWWGSPAWGLVWAAPPPAVVGGDPLPLAAARG